jgi:hypothetical protein
MVFAGSKGELELTSSSSSKEGERGDTSRSAVAEAFVRMPFARDASGCAATQLLALCLASGSAEGFSVVSRRSCSTPRRQKQALSCSYSSAAH